MTTHLRNIAIAECLDPDSVADCSGSRWWWACGSFEVASGWRSDGPNARQGFGVMTSRLLLHSTRCLRCGYQKNIQCFNWCSLCTRTVHSKRNVTVLGWSERASSEYTSAAQYPQDLGVPDVATSFNRSQGVSGRVRTDSSDDIFPLLSRPSILVNETVRRTYRTSQSTPLTGLHHLVMSGPAARLSACPSLDISTVHACRRRSVCTGAYSSARLKSTLLAWAPSTHAPVGSPMSPRPV
ncbi:hypothetical protein C8T65DRAFT_239106 [Cerioporus squamosus]|nr:hypothetical protein C8T65DRAFT_239106 [Cerioporus squamosus]